MFERLIVLLRDHAELAETGTPQATAAIAAAEARLGVTLPASFREYLRRWGTLSFGPHEYAGLGSSISDVLSLTQRARSRGLPKHLVMICDHDGDEYVCLDTSNASADECPVVVWDTASKAISRRRSADFESFLTDDVEAFL